MSSEPDSQQRVRRIVTQRLESLQRAGVRQLRRTPIETPASSTPPTAIAAAEPEPSALEEQDVAATPQPPLRKPDLATIEKEVAKCTRCRELAATRTQTVFGVGNPNARLCFFGEAPGADEDRQGEPFVGRAGRLLTDIIQKGMGLRREDVYILNVLKCRPPGNRNPNADEVANCRGYFERQLVAIRPEFICCLGTVAAQALLETKTPVGRMRGKFFEYEDAKVVVTYHPSYLLRNPAAKKDTWADIQMLMREMGLPIPNR
jgi:DNA polymerase